MGILNVTPDSFSDGGKYTDIDAALERTRQMIESGADIIDVGGESTRPGFSKISVMEEIERTCFVIEAIKERFNIPVSLDTYKSKVAEAGILAGADMINDIWGLTYDDNMASLIASTNVSCCLMHNRRPCNETGFNQYGYKDFLMDVTNDLAKCIDIAVNAGISREKLMIDPGVGFAKDSNQNLEIINNLDKLSSLNLPILLGASRKSFIGNVLGLPVEERLEGTLATTAAGFFKGVTFFRVHDVKENKRLLSMLEAIEYNNK